MIVISGRIAGDLYLVFMLYFSVCSACLEMSTSYWEKCMQIINSLEYFSPQDTFKKKCLQAEVLLSWELLRTCNEVIFARFWAICHLFWNIGNGNGK